MTDGSNEEYALWLVIVMRYVKRKMFCAGFECVSTNWLVASMRTPRVVVTANQHRAYPTSPSVLLGKE